MKILKQAYAGITFMDILLDESLCEGTIAILPALAKEAGGLNRKIKAKQKYELILRIAQTGPVVFIEQEPDICQEKYMILQEQEMDAARIYGWQTDCYIIGKYSGYLQRYGLFDDAVRCVIDEAGKIGEKRQALEYLEEMISHGKKFYSIESGEKPVLICKGSSVCHNILNVMAEKFGNALEQQGVPVIYFDSNKEGLQGIVSYMYKHFRAVVGVQSVLFNIKRKDDLHYVHEYLYGPKYNFVFDHPIYLKELIINSLQDYMLLIHDSNYVDFVKRYYNCRAVLFPPGGMMLENQKEEERIYDLTFVGTYENYRNQIQMIQQMSRSRRFLANRFLFHMRRKTEVTPEKAFLEALKDQKITVSEEEFLDLFYELRIVIFCIKSYYREKIIRTILESGIRLDVFGDSWRQFKGGAMFDNLVCHPNVTVEESLEVWKKSKLSINIMSWHKAGFTERMSSIMLAGAVLVTDDTSYLRGKYDDKEMLIFHLDALEELPGRIIHLLSDERQRQRIAQRGQEKTLREHTWKKRAEQFLNLLEGAGSVDEKSNSDSTLL